MASGAEWLDAFLRYDFDDSYFDNVNVDALSGFTNEENSDSESDSKDEADSESDSKDEAEFDSEDEAKFDFVNPIVGEMFAYMQRHYDKQLMRTSVLMGNGYMEELEEDRFQHSTETISRHFRRIATPEHLQVNKYWPRFEKCVGAIDGTHVLDEAISDPKHGFPWPPTGSYYLVDSGFLIGTSFLPLHQLTRQRYVIVACCALHNFICMSNRGDELFCTWASTQVGGTSSSGLPSHNTEASSSTAT
ncbi:hypothetical protein CMV_003516 [Castanea mollissima]|uniref:DDE Tnp4 domain-containing protein n=1 Tax=Castanea mollissima TaxID=60419 RepID=A0A8J4RNS8_9ROSI|nr:hypothetical protein CMV_003516 [Castanea mollissima]